MRKKAYKTAGEALRNCRDIKGVPVVVGKTLESPQTGRLFVVKSISAIETFRGFVAIASTRPFGRDSITDKRGKNLTITPAFYSVV